MKTNSLSNSGDVGHYTPVPQPRRSRGGTLYLLFWLLLAVGALVYLSALAVAPGQLMALFGAPKAPMTEPNEVAGGDATSPDRLREEVSRLKDELDQVRGEVRTLVVTNQGLTERLDTIENASIQVQAGETSAVPISQGKATAAAEPDDSGITGVVIGEDGSGSEDVAASEPDIPEPAKKPRKKSEEPVDEAVNGQVADAAPEDTPQANVKKKSFGLELAVSTSPEALQLNWDLLNERHGNLLKGLSARAQPSPSDPSSYRLVTGPFTSAQQAQSLCAKLKKQNVTCQVTGFGGDNL